jgi:hypothetical protein
LLSESQRLRRKGHSAERFTEKFGACGTRCTLVRSPANAAMSFRNHPSAEVSRSRFENRYPLDGANQKIFGAKL